MPNATVEIIGSGGVSVVADSAGRFEFPALAAGSATIRASKTGYLPETKTITHGDMQNPHYTPWFKLQREGPLIDLSGPLMLRFQIDPSCAENLPVKFWARQYSTTVPRHSSFAVLQLQGDSFAPGFVGSYAGYSWNTVYASFFGNEVQLYMEDPPIQEELSSSERFWIYGHTVGEVSERETMLPFHGIFAYCQAGEYNCEQCRSSAHVITLIRP